MLSFFLRFITLLVMLINVGYANLPTEHDYDREITALYQNLNPNLSYEKKLDQISASFLGRPYLLGPLGEGKQGYYDQDPLYRTDQYDCLTYVSTVLALTNSKNLNHFKLTINKIRYKNNRPNFIERNHFMTTDWNIANAKKHYIVDITRTIKNPKNESVSLMTNTLIDKPAWYEHMTINRIKLNHMHNAKARLAKLHNENQNVQKEQGNLSYIPLSTLFDKRGKPNQFIFSQIPNASIIEIVRPNWELKKIIGTNLNVSHLGFGFRENGILILRHASTTEKKVVNVPLVIYLERYLNSPTIKGINIQQVLPSQ